MRLIQHVPTFVDGAEPKAADGTLSEILATPWVAGYLTWCEQAQFMCAAEPKNTLMVDGLRDGKRWWWVVGFFDESPRDLPEWRASPKDQETP